MDFDGISGGLLTTWIPHLKSNSSSFLPSDILIELEFPDMSFSFRVINLYDRYSEKKYFWEGLFESQILSSSNIILGGDLNFTLSLHEFWGAHPHRDPMEGYFAHIF
jgi:hypothetical protein